MSDINRMFLSGRLTKDPDIRYTPNGSEVATMSIAVNRSFKTKDSEEWQEETFFINIITWNRLAERVEKNFKKGMPIIVEGRLSIRSYEKDGVKKYVTEVNAYDVRLLQSTNSNQSDVEEVPVEETEPNVPFS
ncbi:MAG: single-stranded DNA-binding protein [Caldisericaceae bacterium]